MVCATVFSAAARTHLGPAHKIHEYTDPDPRNVQSKQTQLVENTIKADRK